MLNRFKPNNRIITKVNVPINPLHLDNTNLTGSLLNIPIPTNTKFQSQTKSNQNSTIVRNNKNVTNKGNLDILQYSAKYIESGISLYDPTLNQFIIYNMLLDYGTEEPNVNNFEIVMGGLYLPDIYSIYQSGSAVVVQLNENYIDYNDFSISDVTIYGKLLPVEIETENEFNLETENDENIIL
jgi:hypothetical protein